MRDHIHGDKATCPLPLPPIGPSHNSEHPSPTTGQALTPLQTKPWMTVASLLSLFLGRALSHGVRGEGGVAVRGWSRSCPGLSVSAAEG